MAGHRALNADGESSNLSIPLGEKFWIENAISILIFDSCPTKIKMLRGNTKEIIIIEFENTKEAPKKLPLWKWSVVLVVANAAMRRIARP
jgi:hypothetical protein